MGSLLLHKPFSGCREWVSLCGGFSGCRAHTLSRHMGSVVVASWLSSPGSVVVAHGLSCFTACGVLLDQESNLCLLHWHVDSSPPSQQGSPIQVFWATSALLRLSFLLNKYPGVGFLDHRVCVCVCVCLCVCVCVSCSVMSDSLWPHGL